MTLQNGPRIWLSDLGVREGANRMGGCWIRCRPTARGLVGAAWVILALTLGSVPVSVVVSGERPRQRPRPAVRAGLGALPGAVAREDSQDERAVEAAARRESRSSRLLAKVRSLVEAEDYAAGVKLLQTILDRPDDPVLQSFSGDEQGPGPLRTLKDEAEELLRSLPSAGRRLYELQYGRAAAQKLADAERADDIDGLREVARRYGLTAAGAEATYRLGSYHLDRGEPLAALLCFERLRHEPRVARQWEPTLTFKTAVCWYAIGEPRRGREVLTELFRGNGIDRLRVAGRTSRPWSSPDQAEAWLRQRLSETDPAAASKGRDWFAYRGDAARNSTASPVNVTGRPAWTRSTLADNAAHNVWSPDRNPEFKARLLSYAARQRLADRQPVPRLPALHPLIVGRTVICRTVNSVQAWDLSTGQLIWQSAVIEPALAEIFRQLKGVSNRPRVNPERLLQTYLNQRWFLDLTSGTLSSDGQLVFVIEDVKLFGADFLLGTAMPDDILYFDKTNKLVALEVDTGRLKWQVGGRRGDHQLPLAGLFFLAAPVPHNGRLYCLANDNGETLLIVLNAADGSLLWSLSLDDLDQRPLPDLQWMYTGNAPSLAAGLLICPVSTGGVIAVDVDRRRPLWMYRYRRPARYTPSHPRALMMQALQQSRFVEEMSGIRDRWVATAPIIADGRVILTPADSDELHCLRLSDGKRLWGRPRDEGLFVATVASGNVIVVGRSQIRALRLQDGQPAWRQPVPIPFPAGQGVRCDSRYHLP
ncbi:MAG TPA: hypothetical protein EYP14_05950, partial [Planctomycetaceae bacterium]|nr:hypothetical protein [Planctomycetaceae bacterium]